MSNARAAHRYAKALLDLAVERKELDRVQEDLIVLGASIRESRELRNLLSSPVIKPHQKEKVLKEIFGEALSEMVIMFLNLLVDHGREAMTSEVIKSFHTKYLKAKGITQATVTSSVKLTDEVREKLSELVKSATGNEVELVEKVDENLIGGFILRVGDKQIDNSIAGKLHELKQQYKDNLYVADF